MAQVFLGLGSNEGDRLGHLEKALQTLLAELAPDVHDVKARVQLSQFRASSIYQTPALLPDNAPSSWNKPFLNCVAQIEFSGSPEELLQITQKLEVAAGRHRGASSPRWAPRPLDIDVLFWQGQTLHTQQLQVPHPEIKNRAFVLDPLAELAPDLILPGGKTTVRELARAHRQHSPRLMGILNITPDSFSDGRQNDSWQKVLNVLPAWEDASVAVLDIGAESTRRGASVVSPEEEWARLEPVLDGLRARYHGRLLRPRLSIDTRRAEVATRALEYGADIINDVSGACAPEMRAVLAAATADLIVMHSLTVPADPAVTLPTDSPASEQVLTWFREQLVQLQAAGVSAPRIWLDPGIGFGKTSLQSLEILKHISALYDLGCMVVAGHSRKSFQKDFSALPAPERDPETLGASFALIEKGVDILRVHDPVLHRRALLARSHLL